MAANPIFVESEEDVPGVIERIKRTSAEEVPLVLPLRSRFGQSRFNFQLLREYASRLGKRVTIVSSDPAVQRMCSTASAASGARPRLVCRITPVALMTGRNEGATDRATSAATSSASASSPAGAAPSGPWTIL